jgi:RNA polymerase sigma-70 factor (ECF subfamily)
MKNISDNVGKGLGLKELEGRLEQAMNELPEQCRTIFQLSRFEELRYREIANFLGISIKTVENQMGKALKILRVKLVDFLPLTILGLLEILKAIV